MGYFQKLVLPEEGEFIRIEDGKVMTPACPIIPFIQGDGIGIDIWPATQKVLNEAVQRGYGGTKRISWFEVHAGCSALEQYGQDTILPEDTLEALRLCKVSLKGPLTTPVGGYPYVCLECAKEQGTLNDPRPMNCSVCGSPSITKRFRSLNVTLRQTLDLFACVRPVRWFTGVPAPVKEPQKLNLVIFRENTEDVYSGIEFASGSKEAELLLDVIQKEFHCQVRRDSGIAIKPMSPFGSKRLIRKAINYAIQHHLPSVTMVHKGNIMKFTEGAFRDWGYELAREEFKQIVASESEYNQDKSGQCRILLNDRIADQMFQQVLLRPEEYHVLATPNLNGDYLSDACAAQVGGLGLAPGANMGDELAVFEATHGTAPKYKGQDRINPSSLILSGVMMLEHLGWKEAAETIVLALEKTIGQKCVTYDLARQMEGAQCLKTSEFADALCKNMP